jgi:UDP-N-acetylenolpyruvoylglucosamine reductase
MMEDVSLESYNTYRIKSKTKYLVLPSSMEELLSNLDWARVNKWKYLVLGNGSNVILPDEEFQGFYPII